MMNPNYTTSISVERSAKEVFTAINNVRGWWQGEIEGESEKLNDEFDYRMREHHFSRQKLIEFIPNEKVVWLVIDSKLNFPDKTEWTGTKIVFEISELDNKIHVRFTHIGLVPAFECYGACSNAWEQLIQESLFSLINTGKGTKVFG